MKNKRIKSLSVLLLFVGLTFLMTYPTLFEMGSSVKDRGDPLLNTWIMAWNVRKMMDFDVQNYFDANIFFPHKRALSFSEHLFPQSLIALPALLISKNPIFAYNFVLLFAFLTSGWGMFLLAHHLTRNTSGSILAGIIYAFSPFMFSHLGHLQIITAGGIPLAFLFLHKFFVNERLESLALFTLFFVTQFLANGYYALYLSLYAGLFLLLYIVSRKKLTDWRFWSKIGLFFGTAFLIVGPFFRQYLLVRKEMGFVREIGFSANLTSFLATSPLNRIYGLFSLPYLKAEGALFPGLFVLVLSIFGFVRRVRKNRGKKPVLENPVVLYSIIGLLSFLFTFGSKGPYVLLYKFVPGFDGLRVASRFHIFVMFALAVLAAFGIKTLFSSFHLKKRIKYLLASLFMIIILIEYLSIPIPLKSVAVKENIPEVYKWFSQQKNEFPIIELPLPGPEERVSLVECPRLYYSTYHWKKLVNGYSGYFPPLYDELKRRWQRHSFGENINDLIDLGVKYIILHASSYSEEELKKILHRIKDLKKQIMPVGRWDEAYVYELASSARASERISLEEAKTVPKKGWSVHSNVNSEKAKLVIDKNLTTRWESGPQKKGVFFELDLGQLYSIRWVSLKLGKKIHDYPRGYCLQLSKDKITWTTVAEEETSTLPLSAFLKFQDLSFDIIFPSHQTRYINIINTGEHKAYYWSIYEIEVYE